MTKVKFVKLCSNARTPTKKDGDAGYDLYSCERMVIKPFQIVKIDIGIALELPTGYVGRILPRSGLALKGIHVMAGVIDESYRSSLGVVLTNLNGFNYLQRCLLAQNNHQTALYQHLFGEEEEVVLEEGHRIAQLVIQKYENVEFEQVNKLSETLRGNGFGSSGK